MTRQSKKIKVKDLFIGGGAPVSIQSMTNTKTDNVLETVEQIHDLEKAGCDIVRVAVDSPAAVNALPVILQQVHIPLVADVHFDYRLALGAINAGVHKVRINPGNIGARHKIEEVLAACKDKNIPIRIGVNAGSLEKEFLEKYSFPTAQGMVESAMKHVEICHSFGFDNIVIALKSSHTMMMIEACQKIADMVPYPLHLGVTEAGTELHGAIRSAIGLGILLDQGIGDTIRVSLTGDPVSEIFVAKEILKTLGKRNTGVTMVSCPTCGRVGVNKLGDIADKIEKSLSHINKPIRVAVMGCAVNGPGEARDADIGIAYGKGFADLFKKGVKIDRISESEIIDRLLAEVHSL